MRIIVIFQLGLQFSLTKQTKKYEMRGSLSKCVPYCSSLLQCMWYLVMKNKNLPSHIGHLYKAKEMKLYESAWYVSHDSNAH